MVSINRTTKTCRWIKSPNTRLDDGTYQAAVYCDIPTSYTMYIDPDGDGTAVRNYNVFCDHHQRQHNDRSADTSDIDPAEVAEWWSAFKASERSTMLHALPSLGHKWTGHDLAQDYNYFKEVDEARADIESAWVYNSYY